MESPWLVPDVGDPDAAPFWQACARRELRLQACRACGQWRHPPRPMCPACGSLEHEWRLSRGTGTIWSFVVPHPPLLPAYAELGRYNVIVVALDDAPNLRLVGNLLAEDGGSITAIDAATIRIGEPVRVTFRQVGDVTLPGWLRQV